MKQGEYSPTEIKAIREDLGLSQAQFAEILRVAQTKIASWENGRFGVTSQSREIIDNLLETINTKVDLMISLYNCVNEFYLIVYPFDLLDSIVKKKTYIHYLKRKNIPHLITWDDESFTKWLGNKQDTKRNRTLWARKYHLESKSMNPRKQVNRKSNNPWSNRG